MAMNQQLKVMDAALVLESFEEPIVIHRSLLRITTGITPALFLTWAVQLTAEAPEDSDGWLTLTQQDWLHATGLSRYEQESARRSLRQAGFIEERRVGMPARLELRVIASAVTEAIREQAKARYGAFVSAREQFMQA